MRILSRSLTVVAVATVIASCAAPANDSETAAGTTGQAAAATAERGGQEEYGPYELVADWPKPLQDAQDGVKHEGWTWGSMGAIYA
jgi:hypothetical protein